MGSHRSGFLLLLSFLFVLAFFCYAKANPYQYQVLRVIDGDTIEFYAEFLPAPIKPVLHLRILGVDTPEKGARAHCPKESLASLNAKLFVEQEVFRASSIEVYIKDWDKYGGRVLGDLILDGEALSTKLIRNGYAREYDGGQKSDWCSK